MSKDQPSLAEENAALRRELERSRQSAPRVRTDGPVGSLVVQASAEMYQGPLPPPEILRRYDEVVPGSAKMLLESAHEQLKHRTALERFTIRHETWRSYAGLIAGAAIGVVGMLASAFVITKGFPISGTILAGGTLTSLVSVFVYGSQVRKEERIQKAQMMTKIASANVEARQAR